MTIDDFRRFLEKIVWYFESENEKELKNNVIKMIKESKLYNIRVKNKEEIIFSLIM